MIVGHILGRDLDRGPEDALAPGRAPRSAPTLARGPAPAPTPRAAEAVRALAPPADATPAPDPAADTKRLRLHARHSLTVILFVLVLYCFVSALRSIPLFTFQVSRAIERHPDSEPSRFSLHLLFLTGRYFCFHIPSCQSFV